MTLSLPVFPILPTARTLVLLALLAPVAVVIAATAPSAWIIAPAAGLTLLLLALVDGWLAGSIEGTEITLDSDSEVGQPRPSPLAPQSCAIAMPLPRKSRSRSIRGWAMAGSRNSRSRGTGEPNRFAGHAYRAEPPGCGATHRLLAALVRSAGARGAASA